MPNPILSNRFRIVIHRLRAALHAKASVLEEHHHYRLAPEVLTASNTPRPTALPCSDAS